MKNVHHSIDSPTPTGADQSDTCPKALSAEIAAAAEKAAIDPQDIRSLTLMILNVNPEQVDATLRDQMATFMQRVKAQNAAA